MTKIKILTTNSKSEEKFIEELEEYILKGWKMKGHLFVYDGNLRIMVQKGSH
jgi:hypothetical protein